MKPFGAPGETRALEEGSQFTPKFDAAGLVTAVATHAETGNLLMVAHMNAEALRRTIESGEAWYWSRSRAKLWKKGETSGAIQRVAEIRTDCDQDAVWLKVIPARAEDTCHTGRATCFYRRVEIADGAFVLACNDDTSSGSKSLTKAEFGKKLYQALLERGWNPSDLHRESGVPRDNVSQYVRGRSLPSPGYLKMLAAALGVSPQALLPNYSEMVFTPDADPAFELKVSSTSPNTAQVRLNQLLPLDVALQIVDLIKTAENIDNP